MIQIGQWRPIDAGPMKTYPGIWSSGYSRGWANTSFGLYLKQTVGTGIVQECTDQDVGLETWLLSFPVKDQFPNTTSSWPPVGSSISTKLDDKSMPANGYPTWCTVI